MRYNNTNKAEKIKLDESNYYVVLDFDKTITSKESLDSWMALIDFDIYGKECINDIKKLNAKYSSIELDYTLQEAEKEQYMVEWYQKSMDLLYKYKLTNTNLLKALQKNKLEFRRGAKEFFDRLYKNKIPVIILSAGIGNVIEEFLKKQECYYNNIYIISNFIEFKEDKMQKFTDSLLHSMNKTIEDIQMVSKGKLEKTITIGFLNNKIEENLKIYNDNFDIVLTNEDACFQEVEKIIKRREEV